MYRGLGTYLRQRFTEIVLPWTTILVVIVVVVVHRLCHLFVPVCQTSLA